MAEGFGIEGDNVALTPKEYAKHEHAFRVMREYGKAKDKNSGVAAVKKMLKLTDTSAAMAEVNRAMEYWRKMRTTDIEGLLVESEARMQFRLRPALEDAIDDGDVNAIRADLEIDREVRKMWGADKEIERAAPMAVFVPSWAMPPEALPYEQGQIVEGDAEESPDAEEE